MAAPALKRHVSDLWPELEPLFEAGEQVEAVRRELGFGHVCALIDAEIATVQRGLDEHAHRYSHQELTWAHGRLSGLKALRDAADAIVDVASRRRQEQAERHERDRELAAQEG
jgi:hypothetical protein